jgi:hypothetical protein
MRPASATRRRTRYGRRMTACLDILTTLFVVATVIVVGGTILLLNNPEASFNPFPKPTPIQVLSVPSPTITITPTITLTPTVTLTPTDFPTFTPTNTFTPSPSPSTTPTAVIPGANAVTLTPFAEGTVEIGVNIGPPTPTESPFEFVAEPLTYQANTNINGCNWLSVAGTVTDINNQPLVDFPVEVIGENFEKVRFSGNDLAFGPAGYEVQIDTRPSGGRFSVRLLGPTGLPVSDFIFVDLGETCDNNVAIVNFIEARR